MNQGKWFIKQGVFLTIISLSMAFFSFIKEAVFANYFGTSQAADAFTIAIQVPEILFSVVWNAINVIVIPLYTEKYCNESKQAASEFVSNLITLFSLGTITFLILGELFANEIVFFFSPGLMEDSHKLAVSLMKCILPMLFFEGIVRISNGLLNVHKEFVIPKILNSVRNVSIIVFLVIFAGKYGVFAAAYGILTGIIAECILFLLFTSKYEKYNIRLNIKDPALCKAGKMIVPVILGIGTSEINQTVDKMIASFLDSGSIANINYASKLSSIIETILLSNIITLMYPTYSRLSAQGNYNELEKVYTQTIKTTILLSMPIAFGGLILSNEIVTLAFKRGAFGDTSALIVGQLFACYLFGSMFTTIRLIGVKLFTSVYDTKTPMQNSMLGSLLNIVLNIILSHYLGAIGLALATTISTAIAGILLLKQAKKKIMKIEYRTTGIVLLKSLLAAFVMAAVIYAVKAPILYSFGLGTFSFTFVSVLIGAGVYLLLLCFLRVSEIEQVLIIIKNVVQKNRL
ncbi:lipid II flippase MurJ [Lachnospiraceae bacterium]|uniref:murein biosynthesis integral membrane protein MurJ n=1 Tax=Candidatus Merdisoma sp. JLR.KK011 TaxID=3114299 RepID=UPI00143477C8|nr:lipid II flippase MurJ [Lachnospiraceae bacterium]